jgi:hypothetical protein
MLYDGVDDDARRKCRARVVEVHHVAASGRVGPDPVDVDQLASLKKPT